MLEIDLPQRQSDFPCGPDTAGGHRMWYRHVVNLDTATAIFARHAPAFITAYMFGVVAVGKADGHSECMVPGGCLAGTPGSHEHCMIVM